MVWLLSQPALAFDWEKAVSLYKQGQFRAAITVGVTVGLLFIERLLGFNLEAVIALAFFGAIVLLMLALVTFLRETRIATALLRIPESYLSQ